MTGIDANFIDCQRKSNSTCTGATTATGTAYVGGNGERIPTCIRTKTDVVKGRYCERLPGFDWSTVENVAGYFVIYVVGRHRPGERKSAGESCAFSSGSGSCNSKSQRVDTISIVGIAVLHRMCVDCYCSFGIDRTIIDKSFNGVAQFIVSVGCSDCTGNNTSTVFSNGSSNSHSNSTSIRYCFCAIDSFNCDCTIGSRRYNTIALDAGLNRLFQLIVNTTASATQSEWRARSAS